MNNWEIYNAEKIIGDPEISEMESYSTMPKDEKNSKVDDASEEIPVEESAETDSFADMLLDCPHYTRPESYRDKASPSVLLSGNHKEIENWKNKKRQEKTRDRRSDLWDKYNKLEDGKKL